MGPSLDLVVRRTHLASDDLMKAATKVPRVVKVITFQFLLFDLKLEVFSCHPHHLMKTGKQEDHQPSLMMNMPCLCIV